jgi:hypothetical protein
MNQSLPISIVQPHLSLLGSEEPGQQFGMVVQRLVCEIVMVPVGGAPTLRPAAVR